MLSPLTAEDAAPESRISKTELCAIFVLCLISQSVFSVLRGQTRSCRSQEPGLCLSLLGLCGKQQPLVEQEDGWRGLI